MHQPTLPSDLAEQATAMRRLARSLVGAAEADDVLQDSLLAATRSRQAIVDRSAWLRGTVRRLSAMWHRSDGRRRRHEQAAAAQTAPTTAAADPAALAVQAELVRDLGVALHALDEPYRSTIVLHYWQGLTSTEIAAQLGVADSTVRSRLQRGVQRLRERLDRRHGDRSAWCTPLTSWLSVEPATAAGAAADLSLLGVIMQGKVLLVAGVALALAWFCWPDVAPRPSPAAARATEDVAQTTRTDGPEATASQPAEPALPRQAAAPPAQQLAFDEVLLRLRCVDENGEPLRDCLAELRPKLLSRAPRPEAIATERSAPDGRVALRATATASSYELVVTAADRVPAQLGFVPLPLGEPVALGDVVLPRGLSLTGRVLDTAGAPVAEAIVQLDSGTRSDQDGISTPARQATTDARGVYVFSDLPPGDAHVRLLREHLLSFGAPAEDGTVLWTPCHVRPGENNEAPDLIMGEVAARIGGLVVDDLGEPVRGARVSSGKLSTCTDFAGRFSLFLPATHRREPCTVHAQASGHRSCDLPDVAWGSSVQLTMPRCPGVQLTVVDESSRRPIEQYAIALASNGDESRTFEAFALPRTERPGGLVHLHSLSPGAYAAWIRPVDTELAAFLVEFEVGTALGSVTALAPPVVERTCEVVGSDGRPIAGTHAEALRARGGAAIRLDSRVVAPHLLWLESVLAWQRSETDADGTFVLRGGAGRPCTLRLLGPGHRPVLVEDVLLADDLEPLRIEVTVGSRVLGKLTPIAVAAQLGPPTAIREAVANTRLLSGENMLDNMRAQVLLRRDDGTTYPDDPKDGNVQDDGSFCIDGVPAGDWQVCLRHRQLGLDDTSYRTIDVLGELRGLDGRTTREQSFDISRLAHGTLRARVLVDGAPLRDADVQLIYRHPDLQWGKLKVGEQAIPRRTDGDGRIVADLPPGEYTIEARLPDEGHGPTRLRATHRAQLVAGQTTEHTFALLRRTLRVRVLDTADRPVAQRRFFLLADHLWLQAGSSDADGWLTIRSLPDQVTELVTWPTQLAERDARNAYIREHPYPEWLDVLQRAGRIDPAHVGDALEVRLSPSR